MLLGAGGILTVTSSPSLTRNIANALSFKATYPGGTIVFETSTCTYTVLPSLITRALLLGGIFSLRASE